MEHIILVAFSVTAPDRAQAENLLTMSLPQPRDLTSTHSATTVTLESWWVAEDDRQDGSDNDSAVFVTPGQQERAARLLYGFDLTPRHNIVERDNNFEADPGLWRP